MPQRARPGLALLLALAASLCLPRGAAAGQTPFTKDQQACANGLNANWLGVLKAQDGDTSACLKSVASGKAAPVDCFGLDLKGKIDKAEAKTAKTTPTSAPHRARRPSPTPALRP